MFCLTEISSQSKLGSRQAQRHRLNLPKPLHKAQCNRDQLRENGEAFKGGFGPVGAFLGGFF